MKRIITAAPNMRFFFSNREGNKCEEQCLQVQEHKQGFWKRFQGELIVFNNHQLYCTLANFLDKMGKFYFPQIIH